MLKHRHFKHARKGRRGLFIITTLVSWVCKGSTAHAITLPACNPLPAMSPEPPGVSKWDGGAGAWDAAGSWWFRKSWWGAAHTHGMGPADRDVTWCREVAQSLRGHTAPLLLAGAELHTDTVLTAEHRLEHWDFNLLPSFTFWCHGLCTLPSLSRTHNFRNF